MSKVKKAHLIGICGKGMSALAIILKEKGYSITGSDAGFYDPVASYLKKNGIKILTPHKASNIPKDTDLIIIGKHAKLTPEENEEVRQAFASKIKIQSLPEALGMISKDKYNVVIAGSFGKSTLTALIAWSLKEAKKDPSYFIGAVPFGFKNNAHLGTGKYFIFEGDEYLSANWDNRSKFLHYNPKDLILISGEHDHINVFPTLKSYLDPYKKLVTMVPAQGLIIASKTGKNISKILKNTKSKIVYYSLNKKNTWHAEKIEYGAKTSFDLMDGKEKVIRLETTLLGTHNIENVIGASTYLLEKKLITKEELAKHMATFKGLSGRLDAKKSNSSVLVYEGYGSTYAKAVPIFEALKLHFPNRKITAIFEPHTFSWRNEEAKKWYKDVFDQCEKVIILPPPLHGSNTHAQISFEEIVKTVKANHKNVYGAETKDEAMKILGKIIKKDDVIVLVSSGSLLGLTVSVPKLMEKMFPKK